MDLGSEAGQDFIFIHVYFCGERGKQFWLLVLNQMYQAKESKKKKDSEFEPDSNERTKALLVQSSKFCDLVAIKYTRIRPTMSVCTWD